MLTRGLRPSGQEKQYCYNRKADINERKRIQETEEGSNSDNAGHRKSVGQGLEEWGDTYVGNLGNANGWTTEPSKSDGERGCFPPKYQQRLSLGSLLSSPTVHHVCVRRTSRVRTSSSSQMIRR